MVQRVGDFRPKGISGYVPAMAYSSAMKHGGPTEISLGTPLALDDDIIDASVDADATANTEEAQDWTSDTPYGRTLILTPSGDPGAAGGVLDVYGEDYLGQAMVERFTGANGSTAILYGKKAFYRVIKTKVVTAATNAITYKLGRGYAIGLPYKGDVQWAQESAAFVEVFKRARWWWADRSSTQAAAGSSKWVYAEFPGYIDSVGGIPDGGGSTNDPVITVEIGGVAVTGLTVTVDTSNAAGLTVTDQPTTTGYRANNRFRPGDVLEIVGASAASALGDRLGLKLVPTQVVAPDKTDPATVSTGDPRGTYEPLATPNGSVEVVVGMVGDATVNASGNGGLHGIQHYHP